MTLIRKIQGDNKIKKKKVSKKTKRSWRKHSDIKDIDEFLEISRFEERTGGPAHEKDDSSLYFVDRKDSKKTNINDKKLDLRCHSSLVMNDDFIKPRATRLSSNKKLKILDDKINNLNSKNLKCENINENVNTVKMPRIYDIWNAEKPVFEDLHNAKVCRKLPPKVPSHHLKKASSLPAVPLPHPGMSYNPTFEQHQDLLATAAEIEIKIEKLEERILRATVGKYPDASLAPTQLSRLIENSEGLSNVDVFKNVHRHRRNCNNNDGNKEATLQLNDVADDDTGDGELVLDGVKVKAVWRGDKKTEKQRRKQAIEKEKSAGREKMKSGRIKKGEIMRLKSIKKEARKKEMESAAKRVRRQLERERRADYGTKKLGWGKFVEPAVPLKLTEELEGSLRLLKPEGHILEDLLRNFQRRNILSARSHKRPQKRRKPKIFKKKSHKEITC